MSLLYDVFPIARVLQAELWARFCEQFVIWRVDVRSVPCRSSPIGPARALMCGRRLAAMTP